MAKRKLLDGHSKTKLILSVLAAVLCFGAVYLVLNYFEQQGETGTVQSGNGFSSSGPQITYNGEQYSYKSRLKNILLMGIDTQGDVYDHEGQYLRGGQSDVIFLVSIDNKNEEINYIQFNRDTMAFLNTYNQEGEKTGEIETQLALSYAYGDGSRASCKNTSEAISKLLYGVPINDYFSINMDAIPILNDAVGGVNVTINDDFSDVDSSLVMGENITLMGEQATHFIRARRKVGEGSNVERMNRHRDYLYSFKKSFFNAAADNAEFVVELDESVADYRVTSMSLERMAEYIQNAREYKNNDIIVPEGEIDYSGELVEVRLDEAKLKDMIVNLFFEKE